MIALSNEIIAYFQKNEEEIAASIDEGSRWYGAEMPKKGLVRFKYYTEDGAFLEFSPIDFYTWSENKHLYNSPVYELLNE